MATDACLSVIQVGFHQHVFIVVVVVVKDPVPLVQRQYFCTVSVERAQRSHSDVVLVVGLVEEYVDGLLLVEFIHVSSNVIKV